MKINIILIFLCFIFQNCQVEFTDNFIVYSNDFSNDEIEGIENAVLNTFEGNRVLGFYNNEELRWNINKLPSHRAVRITLDVFIHDSWDGNVNYPSGPDFWYLKVDSDEVLKTTFSTSPCNPRYCLFQSFPENYPSNLNPKTGAINSAFPGRCHKEGELGYTSLYTITKVIPHKSEDIEIIIGDHLVQDNTDKELCDESWSLNGITISILNK